MHMGFPASDKSRDLVFGFWLENIHIIMSFYARQLASTIQITLKLSGDQ